MLRIAVQHGSGALGVRRLRVASEAPRFNEPSALVAYPIVLPRRRCPSCTRESASAALCAPSRHCNRIASADVRAQHCLSLVSKFLHILWGRCAGDKRMSVWTLRAGAQCVSTEPYSHVALLAGCMYIHPDRGACSPAANSTHDDVDIFWRYSLYRALRNQTAILPYPPSSKADFARRPQPRSRMLLSMFAVSFRVLLHGTWEMAVTRQPG